MNFKKITALAAAGVMAVSLAACGSGGGKASDKSTSTSESSDSAESKSTEKTAVAGNKDAKEKLVVWTLAADLNQFAEHYTESHPDVQIETVTIAPADYPTKVQTAMRGKQKTPDIIVGEPQMLDEMYEAGYFEDLDQDPYNAQQYKDDIVDYVWDVGKDQDGVQRTISYQITPAGIFYRRDIAQEVFGTDDPDAVGEHFKDYATILQTGETLKEKGYKIFASDGEMNFFSGDSAWVVDGKLNVDQARKDYMDLCVNLYQKDMTAYVDSWSTTWYQAMSGSVPVIDSDTSVWDEKQMKEAEKNRKTTEVFAFGLPSWGVLTMRDNVGDLSGKWGVCKGPSYGFSGGTFIGISALSEKKDLAWDFLKFCTLDPDTLDWWIDASQGDVVSNLEVLEKHKDDENPIYGNEKLYQFFLDQAKGIDYSKVTKYDKVIGDAWGEAIGKVKKGEKSKEDAMSEFYDVVESTYPDIKVDR